MPSPSTITQASLKRDITHTDDHDDLSHIPPSTKKFACGDFSTHLSSGLTSTSQSPPLPQQQQSASASASSSGGATKQKKSSGGSTRTGQACDRCKVRKIRCDARPGGCSPCIQNNTECRTTDRITGRATSRGHTEQIENENTAMKMYIIELQQQLRDGGIQPKEAPSAQNNYGQYWGQQPQQQQQQDWNANNSYQALNAVTATAAKSSPTRNDRQAQGGASLLPDFRAGCIGDNYLGVSSENSWLSPIEGTSLALFGTKVDLAEFMPADSDPAVSGMSYRTFLIHAFGRQQVFRPDLPDYARCKLYAEWYFRSIQQFIPVLHKPDFMSLIYKIYHEDYQANSAELVMVHMVLTVIDFQFSMRNGGSECATKAREDSMSHYHYACSLIPDLITGHTLADIQALALICSQLRNQPRPGAAWMFTNLVLGLAIESGLHRSAKAWPDSSVQQDPHHLEMRKRTFYTILLFHVHISGKLGRPMPLRLEDFDIEPPEAIPDNLPDENPNNTWKDCSYRASIDGIKLLKVMMQVYSTIYSIKSTGQYESNVRHLEKELESFHAQIPPEFRGGPQTRDEDRVSALYLDMGVAECQLLLHHPALCRSTSPEFISDNLDVCLHWSDKLLQSAVALKQLQSLDTTWYSSTNFLAAIFTTLFVHTERRDQMTTADLHKLRQDMDSWLEVVGVVQTLLGLSSNLQGHIRNIIDASLGSIQRHIAAKTASAALPATSSPTETHAHAYTNSNDYGEGYSGEHGTNGDMNGNHGQTFVTPAFQTASQYAYPASHDPHVYPQGGLNGFTASSDEQLMRVNSLADQQAAEAAQVAPHSAPANFLAAFHSPTTQSSNGFHHSPPTAGMTMNDHSTYPQAAPAAWRHFTNSVMGGHDYTNSAASLMAMGGDKSAHGTNADMIVAQMGTVQMSANAGAQPPWSLLYSTGNAGQP